MTAFDKRGLRLKKRGYNEAQIKEILEVVNE